MSKRRYSRGIRSCSHRRRDHFWHTSGKRLNFRAESTKNTRKWIISSSGDAYGLAGWQWTKGSIVTTSANTGHNERSRTKLQDSDSLHANVIITELCFVCLWRRQAASSNQRKHELLGLTLRRRPSDEEEDASAWQYACLSLSLWLLPSHDSHISLSVPSFLQLTLDQEECCSMCHSRH